MPGPTQELTWAGAASSLDSGSPAHPSALTQCLMPTPGPAPQVCCPVAQGPHPMPVRRLEAGVQFPARHMSATSPAFWGAVPLTKCWPG